MIVMSAPITVMAKLTTQVSSIRAKSSPRPFASSSVVIDAKADEISMLMGTIQALKDGDTTVDELMKPIRESKEAINHKIAEAAAKAAGVEEAKKE